VIYERVICIVMDGCGAGAAPDAADFGDTGINEGHTIQNVWRANGGINAPLLQSLGLFNAAKITTDAQPQAAFGRLQEFGKGKDTITGHWEMMGIKITRPFPTYPNGFPLDLIADFESAIGTKTIGHMPASGTEIIAKLGETHLKTGYPIVYTSADSVFQIACHESVYPLQKLYAICETARNLLVFPNDVARVIARPFEGTPQTGFHRTENRRDFPLDPPRNLIDDLCETFGPVYGIGVVPEVFNHRGFRQVERTQSNPEHAQALENALQSDAKFIWANFEDFDMLYGHRNDPKGFANAIEQFDRILQRLIQNFKQSDLLILTADHGNDPTTPSTDHSREFVPVCIWSPSNSVQNNLGDTFGMWHIGGTVAHALGIPEKLPASLLQ